MDRLLRALPIAALIVAFAMLWAGLGFLAAIGGTVVIAVVLMAALVVMGPR